MNNDSFLTIHEINSYMIERSHLKIVKALADHGSLTAAANALFLTQSALSHQIRYLEQKLAIKLWQREGRNLRLTQAGQLMLKVAQQVLPVLDKTEQTLQAYADGKYGVLRIGVECHPCYQWLKGVLASYMQDMPAVEVDVVDKFQFSGLEGLLNHHIDLLVTPDEVKKAGLVSIPLFDYELVLIVSNQHGLSQHQSVSAEQLSHELLLTFPVPVERLDIYTRFLIPAAISPERKELSSMDIMVQMVSMNRGVTVLPDWLAKQYAETLPVTTVRVGAGINKQLFAVMHENEQQIDYMSHFINLGQKVSANY